MPGKLIPCALCQVEAAVVFCVNDDANLCTSCDASVHSGNPLLARHERRPLSVLTQQGESAAGAPAASATTDADVAVVPQLSPREAESDTPLPPLPALPGEPAVSAAPLTLYEDSFFARSLSASDLLDLDSDDLLLPPSPTLPSMHAPHNNAFTLAPNHHHHHHDPMADGVVPSFGESSVPRYSFSLAAPAPPMQQQKPSPFLAQQHPFAPSFMRPQQLAPSPLMHYGVRPAYAAPKQRTPEEEAEEAARLARHRERQRKKRNFGRTVRYQSRRAYAEIRPRIKGRFVTPEEYAAYQAQQAAGKSGVPYVPGSAAAEPAPSPVEEDAVVPMPTFVA